MSCSYWNCWIFMTIALGWRGGGGRVFIYSYWLYSQCLVHYTRRRLTPILIDLSALVEWSCMTDYGKREGRRNYADASDDVRANEPRSPVRDDIIYCLLCCEERRDIIRSSWWESHIISLIPFNYTPCVCVCVVWLPLLLCVLEMGL